MKIKRLLYLFLIACLMIHPFSAFAVKLSDGLEELNTGDEIVDDLDLLDGQISFDEEEADMESEPNYLDEDEVADENADEDVTNTESELENLEEDTPDMELGLEGEENEEGDSEEGEGEEGEEQQEFILRPLREGPIDFIIGNSTKINGNFFGSQFGNNISDMDVRNMIQGYNPVTWVSQVEFTTDSDVVESLESHVYDSNTEFVVTLDQNLKWNDGTPITAADYVFSYLLQSSAEFAELGVATGMFAQIVGYDDYVSGDSIIFSGIRLLSDYSYSVTIKGSYEPYFYELSYLSAIPYPISVIAPGCVVVDDGEGAYITDIPGWEKEETETTEEVSETDPNLYVIEDVDAEILRKEKAEERVKVDRIFTTDLIRKTILDPETGYLYWPYLTCGVYKLMDVNIEEGTVDFAINPYHKSYPEDEEEQEMIIENIRLVKIASEDAIEAILNGDIDLYNKCVDGDVITQSRVLYSDQLRSGNYARMGYGFLGMACEKGPQQFLNVRQALSYCVDRPRFLAEYLKGYGMEVYGYYGIGQWCYQAANHTLQPEELTEEEQLEWDALMLELEPYEYDLEKALQLLIEDGWTLNAFGEPFDPTVDDIRYKKIDEHGTLMRLSFTYAQSEGSKATQLMGEILREAFEELNAEIIIEEMPFNQMYEGYNRLGEDRPYDIYFLATNFVSTFDPYMTIAETSDYAGSMNTSGMQDQELIDLAWELRTTEPDDELTYVQRWILFQQRYNEVLPTIPIYSNVYFDIYIPQLNDYAVNAVRSWPAAIRRAWLGDPVFHDEETEEELPGEVGDTDEFEDDDFEFID